MPRTLLTSSTQNQLVMEVESNNQAIHCLGTLRFEVAELQGSVNTIAWYPDGNLLAVGASNNQLLFVRTCAGRVLYEQEHEGGIQGIEYSPDGNRVAVAVFSKDKALVILDSLDGRELKRFSKMVEMRSVTWSSDSSKVITVAEATAVT